MAQEQQKEPTVSIEFNQKRITEVIASLRKRPLEEIEDSYAWIMQHLQPPQSAAAAAESSLPQ